MPVLRIGVLGSTRGTTMQSLADIIASPSCPLHNRVEIVLVISNKQDAGILERARQLNVPSIHISALNKTREQYDGEICSVLEAAGVELVLLIGYMRVLSPLFTCKWYNRCLNVHPSLLPDFAGGMDLDVHSAVLAAGKRTTGCTVHIVNEKVDGGPIIVQKQCDVIYDQENADTAETLKAKVQKLEAVGLVEAISMFIDGKFSSLLDSTVDKALHTNPKNLTYLTAGVNIDAGAALVNAIKPYCKSTGRSGSDTVELGGFGGLFDLAASGYNATDTILVAGTDGVGTKLKIAQAMSKNDTIGFDLVAMCVNDILVCGAEPLFFLDYYATGSLDVTTATEVIKGIAEGCKVAGNR